MTRASTVRSVIAYQVRDLVRSRWLAAYTLFFLVASEGLLRYGGGASKALLSLGSIVLFVVPLVTAVFGTVYVYNSRDYTELLLAQPVRRGSLYAGLYLDSRSRCASRWSSVSPRHSCSTACSSSLATSALSRRSSERRWQ
jgi:hypothetical protein